MSRFSTIMISALLGALSLTSCRDKQEELSADTYAYTFELFGTMTGSIDDLATRASDPIYSLLAVDVKDGAYVQQVTRIQLPSSQSLANVEMQLTSGLHHIYFLCAAKPWAEFDPDQLQVHWTEQNAALGDTWSACVEVDVQGKKAQPQTVQLSRVVAYIRTTMEDALPSHLSFFRQILVGGSWSFDLVSQTGGMAQQIVHDFAVPQSVIGQSGVSIGLYTFVPESATEASNYTLSAFDAQSAPIQSYTFYAVPLAVNQYTNYKGTFFDVKSRFGISLQTDWLDPVVIGY